MITAAVTAAILYSVKAKRDSDQAYSRRALARDTKEKSSGNVGPQRRVSVVLIMKI